MNGKKTGDPWGKITSYQWNGRAVVDYVIVSCELFKTVTSFMVGDYSPWVSDHCPLLFEMHSVKHSNKTTEKLKELPQKYHLCPRDKEKFVETLNSNDIREKLTKLNTSSHLEPQKSTSKLIDIMTDTCEKAGIKPSKQNVKMKINEPWFDEECKILKNSLRRKCRKLRKNQNDEGLHVSVLKDNKSLKKLMKRKREDYKRGIVDKLNINKRDQIFYWKLVGKLQTKKYDIYQQQISGVKWNNHFREILVNNKRNPEFPPDSSEDGHLDYAISVNELYRASYVLKPSKACGFDSITNEMILGLLEVKPNLIIELFNDIFLKN